MALTEYPDLEQRSPEWYAARCGIVTASAVGALLTPTLKVADNDHSRGLTALLVAERITGHVEPTYQSDDMLRGELDEPVARDLYSEHYSAAYESGFMVRDDWGFRIGFSPDGLVGENGLIEVKSRRQKKHLQTILADEVPPENMAQLQCGLLVSGRLWIDYVSYCGGMPLYVKRVFPDMKWFAAILAAVSKFEDTADKWTASYAERTKDMPATERLENNLGLVF